MPLHGKNFIAGALSAEGSDGYRALDPKTSETLEPHFTAATEAEVDASLDAAVNALGALRRQTPEERATMLERMADEIMKLGDELVERCHRETALPTGRVEAERGRTVGQLRLFASMVREGSWVDARIDRGDPDRSPLPKPDVRRMLVPLGPVAVFGASNFPLAFSVAGGDTASALAAGSPVIVKAHRSHPGTAELVASALSKAIADLGLPGGVFSMVHGSGRVAGMALVKHPQTKAVGFTGSTTGGRSLFDAASSRPEPIPVYAEMGSLNPVFVLPGALRERATQIAEGLSASVTLGVGQFCTGRNPR